MLIVIVCLKEPVLRYLHSGKEEIHVISASWARQYIPTLARQDATVVVIHKDLHLTVDTLAALYHERSHSDSSEYLDHYKRAIAPDSDISKVHVSLPRGHCDLPMKGPVYLVVDGDGFDPLDERNVATQQILRFAALKHGARFSAASGLLRVLRSPASILSLLDTLQDPKQSRYIYDSPDESEDQLVIHQNLPLGWDSWNRIRLLATSIPASDLPLLDGDTAFSDLDDIYNRGVKNRDQFSALSEHVDSILGVVKEEPPSTHYVTYKELASVLKSEST